MRRVSVIVAFAALSFLSAPFIVRAETLIRYSISMADVPLTTGQPDRGVGGCQFTGYTLRSFGRMGMNIADRSGWLVSGLATEWKADDTDKTK